MKVFQKFADIILLSAFLGFMGKKIRGTSQTCADGMTKGLDPDHTAPQSVCFLTILYVSLSCY